MAKLSFFGVNKKLNWKKIPTGAHNAAPVFDKMMDITQDEWHNIFYRIGIPDTGCGVITYDIILIVILLEDLINYLYSIPEVLSHYCCTLKLKKTHFLGSSQYVLA